MLLRRVTGGPIKQPQNSPAKNRGLTDLTLQFTRLSTTASDNIAETFAFLKTRRETQKSQKSLLASRSNNRLLHFQLSKNVVTSVGSSARILANSVATFCSAEKISSTLRSKTNFALR